MPKDKDSDREREAEQAAWDNIALKFMLESRKKHPELYEEKPKDEHPPT